MTDFFGGRGHFWSPREVADQFWLHRSVGFDFHDDFESHAFSNSDDSYMLGAGSDRVVAGSGVDHIWAGTGNDSIWAGAGDDVISAWDRDGSPLTRAWGIDEVHGGAGNDIIMWSVTTSDVTIFGDDSSTDGTTGAPGNDTISTGSGNDFIDGGGGDDVIWSGAGKDVVFGGEGKDIIEGFAGNDRLHGEAGSDVITGGLGADQLWGGTGADKFIVNSSSESGAQWINADVIHDFKSTNNGATWDTIDLPGQGTKQNFGTMGIGDHETWEESFNGAKGAANTNLAEFPGHKYVFVEDGHDGWLFADTNGDHRVDTAIELRGVTHFDWHNIV